MTPYIIGSIVAAALLALACHNVYRAFRDVLQWLFYGARWPEEDQ